jgi:hypothetical protein
VKVDEVIFKVIITIISLLIEVYYDRNVFIYSLYCLKEYIIVSQSKKKNIMIVLIVMMMIDDDDNYEKENRNRTSTN